MDLVTKHLTRRNNGSRRIRRSAAGIAGVSLVASGLYRRGWSGAAMAVLGADLLYNSVRREGHFPGLLRPSRKEEEPYGRGVQVKESVVVRKPAWQLYAVWRDFENVPLFMGHVKGVEVIDDIRSRWSVDGAVGGRIEWEAEVIADREDEIIGWRTIEDAAVAHAGSVRFQPVGRKNSDRTRVTVTLQFNPPAGKAGAAVARLLGADPSRRIREDLERFRQLAEAMDLTVLARMAGKPAAR